MVATAKDTLSQFEAEYEMLDRTNIRTPIGNIVVVLIKKAGNALIAGPSVILDMEKIINIFNKYTPKSIFIDGAFFRHSLAKISEATIFVVGANLTNNIDKVIDYAALTSKKFKLEKVDERLKKLAQYNNVCFVNEHNEIYDLGFDSVIGNTEKIFKEENKKYRFLYLPKSLSNNFLLKLVEHRRQYRFDIILNSPVSIQLNLDNLNYLFKLKNKVFVLNSINLVATCLNPFSPRGYEFDKQEFKEKLENILGVEVFNVKEEVTYE
ncbi:MAG: hypothetical protein KAH13_01915 [Tenericutes bacterium]|nr:hypothetical protein [Mycoplasmatota bacterium]